MGTKSSTTFVSFVEPVGLEHILNNEPDLTEYIEKYPESAYLEIYEAYTKSFVRNISVKSYDLAFNSIKKYIEANYIPEDGSQAINELLTRRREAAVTSKLLSLKSIADILVDE